MYRLLLVDNEKAVLDGLSHALVWEELGFETIDLAYDGEMAWQMAQSKHYHLIISDIRMQPMDGLELLKCISQSGLNTRVIMLTAYDETDYILRALRLGAVNYLMKPIEPSELRRSVIDALRPFALSDAAAQPDSSQTREFFLRSWLFDSEECRDLGIRAALAGVNIFLRSYNIVLLKTSRSHGAEAAAAALACCQALGECYLLRDRPGEYVLIIGGRNTEAALIKDTLQSAPDLDFGVLRALISSCVSSYKEVSSAYQDALAYLDDHPHIQSGIFTVSDSGAPLASPAPEPTKETALSLSPLVQRTVDYLKAHCSMPLSLNQIAQDFGVNATYLGFQFHMETGVYFNDYLNDVRIDRARTLLKTTSQSVYSIATEVGYSSVNYFCQVFKKQTHLSPTQFRERR